MEIIKIHDTKDKYFAPLWEIYEYSFPYHEQRTLENQQGTFSDSRYMLDAYVEDWRVIGLNGYWDFGAYIYIEHLAMSRDVRGSGLGSRIMRDFLASAGKPVILEIDPVVDEISARRLEFYKRLGYVLNPHVHIHNPYHEDGTPFELTILTYPTEVSAEVYRDFKYNHDTAVVRR